VWDRNGAMNVHKRDRYGHEVCAVIRRPPEPSVRRRETLQAAPMHALNSRHFKEFCYWHDICLQLFPQALGATCKILATMRWVLRLWVGAAALIYDVDAQLTPAE
jgi:hypothetical protein